MVLLLGGGGILDCTIIADNLLGFTPLDAMNISGTYTHSLYPVIRRKTLFHIDVNLRIAVSKCIMTGIYRCTMGTRIFSYVQIEFDTIPMCAVAGPSYDNAAMDRLCSCRRICYQPVNASQ